jgi:hypothetical protein
LIVTHPGLNNAIGQVATASAAQDELLRLALSGLTDVTFSYVLFEGVSGEQLSSSLRAVLDGMFDWIEKYGAHSTYVRDFDPSRPEVSMAAQNESFRLVVDSLVKAKALRELRNVVIHGTWKRIPYAIPADPRPRPWADKSLTSDAVFYCTISKLRKMFVMQAFTVADVEDLAAHIRASTKDLASALTAAFAELVKYDMTAQDAPDSGLFDEFL